MIMKFNSHIRNGEGCDAPNATLGFKSFSINAEDFVSFLIALIGAFGLALAMAMDMI